MSTNTVYDLNEAFKILGAIALPLILIITAIVISLLVISIVALYKIFKKAGRNGWEAIIPFYNIFVLVEISGLAKWWFILLIAPNIISIIDENLITLANIASLVGSFVCYYNLSKKFHKDTGFAILATLLPIIALPILAFSNNCQYDFNVSVDELGPFGKNNQQTNPENTNTNTEDHQKKYCQNCGTAVDPQNEYCKNCGTKLK